MDYAKVSTAIQAKFHLDRGEVLILPVDINRSIYISKDKDKDDRYTLAIIPKYGLSKTFNGDFKAVTTMVDSYTFTVIPGGELCVKKDLSLVDKFVSWMQSKRKG